MQDGSLMVSHQGKGGGKSKGNGACLPFLWLVEACLIATKLCDTAQPTIFITAQRKHWAWNFTCSCSLYAISYPQGMVLGQGESKQSCAFQNMVVSAWGKRVVIPFWGGTAVWFTYLLWMKSNFYDSPWFFKFKVVLKAVIIKQWYPVRKGSSYGLWMIIWQITIAFSHVLRFSANSPDCEN